MSLMNMCCASSQLLRKCSLNPLQCHLRTFQSTRILGGIKWRAEKGLPLNPTSFGPLTNLPDYTYDDGRVTPLGRRISDRIKKQKQIAERIVQLCNEVEFAKERHSQLKKEEEQLKQKIMDEKFKGKGTKILE